MSFSSLIRWSLTLSIAVACFMGAAPQAFSQLIAADGFNAADYEDPFFPGDARLGVSSPGAGDGSGPNADGNPVVTPGWVDDGDGDPSAWNVGTGNLQWDTDASNPSLQSAGVAYDDDSTGKGVFTGVPAGGFGVNFRAGDRVLDDYTAADTYYMSMFLNSGGLLNDGSGVKQHALVGFTNSGWDQLGVNNDPGAAANPFGLMVGFHGEDADSNPAATDQVDLVIRARQNDISDPILTDTVLVAGTSEADISNITYHVMMKLEINIEEGATDRVTYWVDPSDVSSEATATISAAATGIIDTLAVNETDDLDRLRVVLSSWENRRLFFDEVRLAYDFASLRGDIVSPGIPGDFDGDGDVDIVDFGTFGQNFGLSGLPTEPPTDGDFDADGDVDIVDFGTFGQNFGTGTGGGTAVPEPATALLLMSLLMVVGTRRSCD